MQGSSLSTYFPVRVTDERIAGVSAGLGGRAPRGAGREGHHPAGQAGSAARL